MRGDLPRNTRSTQKTQKAWQRSFSSFGVLRVFRGKKEFPLGVLGGSVCLNAGHNGQAIGFGVRIRRRESVN
jgi:hypothetical protein